MQFARNRINRRMVLRSMTTIAAALGFGGVVTTQKSLAVPAPTNMQNPENSTSNLGAIGSYTVESVSFESNGVTLVGNLYLPQGLTKPAPAVPILGPVAFVKEQSPVQYATRLAKAGFIALAFDPCFHGASGGEPRRYEHPQGKVADFKAAINYLLTRSEVDRNRIYALGVCQGVNWTIQATTEEPKIKALAIVAGHYLTKETIDEYNGGAEKTLARIERGQKALAKYKATGEVDYIPIVSLTDPHALLTIKHIYEWYIRWADRGPAWTFHGQWENRITAMSEAEIWAYRVDETIQKLSTPTLMVHADRAASGETIPKDLFAAIPTTDKKLVWLGNNVQFQFYEEPETIDRSVANITEWFNSHT